MSIIILGEADSSEHDLVGGKGANLGRLISGGFSVPPGFVVSTIAYREFLTKSGLSEKISDLLCNFDYQNIAHLEEVTGTIRALFEHTEFPDELEEKIRLAYGHLGDDDFVAVRSSGTAEDLEGASFAGLHDTYLDVFGADDVLEAIKRCWISLWTARATGYRQRNKFDHLEASLAVVVQRMVRSDISGVMFTGNPLTGATDEIVINASWGLGEAIVQGITSPDQFVLGAKNLMLIESSLGTKAVQVVRSPLGRGVVEEEVSEEKRRILCLTPEHLIALGKLGRDVEAYYGSMPQDIEWGIASNNLYLLQSRPITGVDFSWDAECSDWQAEEEDPHAIWTRVPMDDQWTGAITPLMYSWRGESWAYDIRAGTVPILGLQDIAGVRAMKYFRGEAYENAAIDLAYAKAALPAARPVLSLNVPKNQREEATNAKFSYLEYAQMYVRAKILKPEVGGPYGWMRILEDYQNNRLDAAKGLPNDQLSLLSDGELKRYLRKQINFEHQYNQDICIPGLWLYGRDIYSALGKIVEHWYDGDNQHAFTELVAGSPRLSMTLREHVQLHEMSRVIKESKHLLISFETYRDGKVFENLTATTEGKEFKKLLDAFLEQSGHRGHAERDIYFPRYADDLAILYRALQAHIKSDVDPMIRHREINERRQRVMGDVERNLRKKPFGFLKVEAFKWCLHYVLEYQNWRDDERHFIDYNTYSIRNGFLDVNRRLVERGLVDSDRDFWFLTMEELYELLGGPANRKLTQAKIKARMQNFDAFDQKEYSPPKFLYRNRELREETDGVEQDESGLSLKGTPTSRGVVTGVARVIKQQSQIGRLQKGDILIANSTDPGWTPVFALISGVIVETGGLLSHSSCLAREYGFPAAQIEGALRLIPDGATITLDGDRGVVRIHEAADEPVA